MIRTPPAITRRPHGRGQSGGWIFGWWPAKSCWCRCGRQTLWSSSWTFLENFSFLTVRLENSNLSVRKLKWYWSSRGERLPVVNLVRDQSSNRTRRRRRRRSEPLFSVKGEHISSTTQTATTIVDGVIFAQAQVRLFAIREKDLMTQKYFRAKLHHVRLFSFYCK